MLASDLEWCEEKLPEEAVAAASWRSRYTHLVNLRTLFDFCIPVVFDYGATLKSPDGKAFAAAQLNLFALYLLCDTTGGRPYRHAMLVYLLLSRYWQRHNFPLAQVFTSFPTFFSEESGEIALSCLAQNQPTAGHVDIESSCRAWQMVKMKVQTSRPGAAAPAPPTSKFRVIDPDETAVLQLTTHFR